MYVRSGLYRHLPYVLYQKHGPVSPWDIRRVMKDCFGQRIAPDRLQNYLGQIKNGNPQLFFLTISLLETDGVRRVGTLEGLLNFCRDHRDLDANEVSLTEKGQAAYVKALVREFPALEFVQKMQVLSIWLIDQYASHLAQHGSVEVPPMLVIDGPSGIGKTTISRWIRAELARRGHEVLYLTLDMFLKDRAWRRQTRDKLIYGAIDPAKFDESSYWAVDQNKTMLVQLQEFRSSGDVEGELFVPGAYDPVAKTYQDLRFPLRRGMVIFIEGKYAFLPELQPHYGDHPFCFRLKHSPEVVRAQFELREVGDRSQRRKQMLFYDKVLVGSFDRYAAATQGSLTGQIDLAPEEGL